MKPFVIAIAGGTGSGKTTLARALARHFGEHAAILAHDDYYRDHPELTDAERAAINYDAPESLETDLLRKNLCALRAGLPAMTPRYDFTTHSRRKEMVTVEPVPIILLEGILILTDEALRDLIDLKVFLDVPESIRFERRITRDTQERGRTPESCLAQYRTTVAPMHARHVEPSRAFADMILREESTTDAVERILARIRVQVDREEKIV